MRFYNHPARPMNPYPRDGATLSEFRYDSALSLIRPKGSVEIRNGEDADYILQHDFLISLKIDGQRRAIAVPRGLITDLTSVPRPLRIFVGRVGPWLEAAILHDYLYIAWQDIPGRGARRADRAFADRTMLLAMAAARVGWLRRMSIYLFLRAFGTGVFRRPNEDRYVDLSAPQLKPARAFTLPNRHQSGTLSMPEPPQG